MRIKLWKAEARAFAIAPFFSFFSLAFLFAAVGLYCLSVHKKNEQAVMCLAENLYHEGRGEKRNEKYVLGMLTLARVVDPDRQWAHTICGVVAQDKQFSWTLDYKLATNRSERAQWEEAGTIARDLIKNAWITYKLPAGWECARFYKRTDGKGVSKISQKFFDTKLFPVGMFGKHTAFQERRGCTNPLPTV